MLAYIRRIGTNGMPCVLVSMPTMPVAMTRANHAGFSPLRASVSPFLLESVKAAPLLFAGRKPPGFERQHRSSVHLRLHEDATRRVWGAACFMRVLTT